MLNYLRTCRQCSCPAARHWFDQFTRIVQGTPRIARKRKAIDHGRTVGSVAARAVVAQQIVLAIEVVANMGHVSYPRCGSALLAAIVEVLATTAPAKVRTECYIGFMFRPDTCPQ